MVAAARDTVWIFGDQLQRKTRSLAGRKPGEVRILFVESRAKIEGGPIHRQRLHLVLAGMRRFARELAEEGFEVDYRAAPSMRDGLAAHRAEHRPARVVAMTPMSWSAAELLDEEGVERLPNDQFVCSYEGFTEWASGQKRLRMEDFYRWQRERHHVLMEGDAPVGGRWNYDAENREPPPGPDHAWPAPPRSTLDALDAEVVASLPETAFGAPPDGTWATTRRGALARLRHFVRHGLPRFGPHQDAMTEHSWHLAHSLLSPYLNLGMLHPMEVVRAAEAAYAAGGVPIASAEGFIRQVLGWREYVWGVYWHHMPGYRSENALDAHEPLPRSFETLDPAHTEMACVRQALQAVHAHGYAHHIQRLMVLGNLSLTAGIEPAAVVRWMSRAFVDGAEWVMLPNALSMALYADGGRMTTKPYASGGAYISRMSDACGGCAYDPKKRVGERACPFTTLYWDFLDRHRERFRGNHRISRAVAGLDRLEDFPEVRERAQKIVPRLRSGQL